MAKTSENVTPAFSFPTFAKDAKVGHPRAMQRLTIFIVFVFSLGVLSCGKPTEESLTEVKNGAYKVDVRSQEFHHSGIRNVDICVADVASSQFPTDKAQCFLHAALRLAPIINRGFKPWSGNKATWRVGIPWSHDQCRPTGRFRFQSVQPSFKSQDSGGLYFPDQTRIYIDLTPIVAAGEQKS